MNGLSESIVKRLIEAKESYYAGEPIMSDSEFDTLEDEFKEIDPTNLYFNTVGITASKEKVKHNIPMLSCDKAKTVEGIVDWIEKMNIVREDLLIEPKIDGVSCSIIYDNGFIQRVATRGDGLIGQDISHILKFINIPTVISLQREKIEVRGELYLPKNTNFPNPDNKPLRSLAGGLLNRKDSGLDDLKFVKFVAYQLYGSSLILEENKLTFLEGIGFRTVPYWVISSDIEDVKRYSDLYLSRYREEWEFQTDGLVFVVNNSKLWDYLDSQYTATNHHYYNIALKPPPVSKETILEGIEWNVSRLGKVIPTAVVKPVIIGGSTITRCSLSNVENVEKLRLKIGDRIEIERSNDVIPYFKANKEDHVLDLSIIPHRCPSCYNLLDRIGPHLICSFNACTERIIMEIVHWVQTCEMDGLSESFVRKLVEAGRISSVKGLYELQEKDFMGIEGFGPRKIEIGLEQIKKSRTMSVRQFLTRLGINGVGKKALEKLGINSVDEVFSFKTDDSFIGNSLEAFVKENSNFIHDLLSVIKVDSEQSKADGLSLGNVCMTGSGHKTRKDLIIELNKMGYTNIDNVNKDTNILVCEDVNGSSSKLVKARKLGIKIISYEEFFGKEKS